MKESIALNDQLGPRPTAVIIGKLTMTTPMRPPQRGKHSCRFPRRVADTDRRVGAMPRLFYLQNETDKLS